MKREILFRGKRIDSGEWVYGWFDKRFYVIEGLSCRISENKTTHILEHIVESETVGQFTGLLDKNGAKIFEGDHFGNKQFYVHFINGCFMLGSVPLKGYLNGEYMEQVYSVTGNIHQP